MADDHDDAPPIHRVHPAPGVPITIGEAYDVERPAPSGRPWVGLCMVSSLDGSVAIDGTSGGLGNPNDIAVLGTLRRLADVVVVGAHTASGEGYGPPRKSGQRIGVVTNSGDVDLTSALFESGAGFVIAPESADVDEHRVDVLRSGRERVDVAAAIAALPDFIGPAAGGVAHVQAEGGPTLNGALLAADVVDEIALTWSPRVVGGDGPRLTNHTPEIDARFDLAHLLVDGDGFVFGRWVRRRA